MFAALALSLIVIIGVTALVGISDAGEISFRGSETLASANATVWSTVEYAGVTATTLLFAIGIISLLVFLIGATLKTTSPTQT